MDRTASTSSQEASVFSFSETVYVGKQRSSFQLKPQSSGSCPVSLGFFLTKTEMSQAVLSLILVWMTVTQVLV